MEREHLMALMASLQFSWVTAMMYAATRVVERDTPAMLTWTRKIDELNAADNPIRVFQITLAEKSAHATILTTLAQCNPLPPPQTPTTPHSIPKLQLPI